MNGYNFSQPMGRGLKLRDKNLYFKEKIVMKRVLSLFLSTLLLAVLLCGCAAPKNDETPSTEPVSGGEPVTGGDLTVGIAQDIDTLDPHMIVSAGGRELLFNVFEGLIKPDTSGNMVPAIAESFDISDTGDVFTFTLREGVLFHNGSPVTAEDVIYSINRAAEPTSLVKGFETFESVEATDEKTVVITLSEPYIEFLACLSGAYIIPEGIDPATEAVGTGPFKFVSRSPQESIVLEKFDDYYGTPAYVDTVTYKIIESNETLVMSLKSGAIDLVTHLTAAQAAELGSDFNVVEGTMNIVQGVYLNNAEEPFNNIKVRQALSYAVDRQMVLDILADGKGAIVGSSMYPAFTKYFDESLVDYYTYDPDKAKSLLAEAGFPDGFDMEITVPTNYGPHMDTAEIVAEQLKAVGVRVTIVPIDWESWLSDVYVGRKFQSTIVGFDASVLTAGAMLERFVSDHAENMISFNNSEYDEIYAQITSCTDDAEQVKLYGRLQEILTEDAANLYIQDLCDIVAMAKNVGGYEFYPLYVMDMSKVFFTE